VWNAEELRILFLSLLVGRKRNVDTKGPTVLHLGTQDEEWILLGSVVLGPGRSIGIKTGYGLDGPGSNAGGGDIFRTCPDRLRANPPSCTMGTGFFQGAKRPRRDVDHPPPSSVVVMKG
jgi:hypothetical protein